MATGVEIPFWIFGQQKWVSGINRNTTCQEVSLTLSHGVISEEEWDENMQKCLRG